MIALRIIVLLTVLAAPLAARAQQGGKVYRIGVLGPRQGAPFEAFVGGLRDRGWVDGRNIIIVNRDGPAELVALGPDVILVPNATGAMTTSRATKTIPIVVAAAGDLVAVDAVASLAHPGGNITGLQILQPDLAGKRMQLLREAVRNLSRVGLLLPGESPIFDDLLRQAQIAAATAQLDLHVVKMQSGEGAARAFVTLKRERAEAVIVVANPFMNAHRVGVVELASANKIPAIYESKEFVSAGGLMAYGASIPAMFNRAAGYVDKILNGAKPADLPVEQPTKFELVINLKTAKALGLTIPPTLLLQADQVIE